MAPQLEINDDVSLRDIIAAYPQTRAVMAKYGLMECGGAAGPDEPLGWFARVHQVDAVQLKREMQEAIAQGDAATPAPQAEAATAGTALDADGLFRRFLVTAVVLTLTGGVLWGAINLTLIALHRTFVPSLAAGTQAHAHVQIFGWCALFIMGVAYHVIPRLKAAALQHVGLGYASFWLMAGGVLLHAVYRPFMANAAFAPLPVLAGLMELAGAVAFTVVIVSTMRKGTTAADPSDKYLAVGTVGFVLMAMMNAALLSYMAAIRTAVLPEQWNWAYYHWQLYGFITLFIFGVSLRTLPVFLGKPQPNLRLDRVIFPIIVLGILLRTAGDVLVQYHLVPSGLLLLPTALECGGILAFVWNLGVFKRQSDSMDGVPAESRAYEKYLYAGYGWLLLATLGISALSVYRAVSGLPIPHALMGSYMHALTVGFITVMILGYAMRTIPVFLGRPVHSIRLLNATFVLMMIGCTMRVVFQALTVPFGTWPFAVAGMSGWLEAVGLTFFGYNLLRTLYQPEAVAQLTGEAEDADAITGKLTIARLVELHPQMVEVLIAMGFEPLANPMLRQTLGKKITIETAAQIKHIPVDDLLQRIREAA
ncbi:MAG: DUF1858 domain-containing protein [Armatimonadota bacterium]